MIGKIMGNSESITSSEIVKPYFNEGEEFLKGFKLIRDEIIFTNYGIYYCNIQGVTGKKIEVAFYPKDTIIKVAFETAGHLDLDSEIKIKFKGENLGFKVNKKNQDDAMEIIKIVKQLTVENN